MLYNKIIVETLQFGKGCILTVIISGENEYDKTARNIAVGGMATATASLLWNMVSLVVALIKKKQKL